MAKTFLSIIICLIFFPLIVTADICNLADQLAKEVEQIRDLKFKQKVPCKVQSQDEVKKHIETTVKEGTPAEKIKSDELIQKKLDLIPDDYRYLEEALKLYSSQISGFYDYRKNFYSMAKWLPREEQPPITVHELTHALQDQNFNLDMLGDPSLTTDESLAQSAVIEGDASIVMFEYILDSMGEMGLKFTPDLSPLIDEMVEASESDWNFMMAPQAMKYTLLFPYTRGLKFSHYIYLQAGNSGLNKIFSRLPKTTKEILHPDKYLSYYKFNPLRQTDLQNFFLPNVISASYTDRLGEFMLMLLTYEDDNDIASAWLNDLIAIDSKTQKLYWLIELNSEYSTLRLRDIFEDKFDGQISIKIEQNKLGVMFH